MNRLTKLVNQLEYVQLNNDSTDIPQLKISKIRYLDIGKNYFKNINPRKKKIFITFLDAYIENLSQNGEQMIQFEEALNLYFENSYQFTDAFKVQQFDLSTNFLWHLYALVVFDRISAMYARYEYLDQSIIIDTFNNRPKDQRNKVKYVFTSHPTQPNSIDQIKAQAMMIQGLEENDPIFLNYAVKCFIQSIETRQFVKPTYLEESITYHRICIPNMIRAISMAYELGLKNIQDFYDTPGTWITFDFDNHPEMQIGIMTYTNGLLLEITVNEYINLLTQAQLTKSKSFQPIMEIFNQILDYSHLIRDISDSYRVKKEFSKEEFFQKIPIFNIYKLEDQLIKHLDDLQKKYQFQIANKRHKETKYYTTNKLYQLMNIFRLTGVLGQVRIAGEDLMDINNIKPVIHDVLREISLLNFNIRIVDMAIIANYITIKQYQIVEELMKKYKIENVEIVPLLETFSSTNTTNSSITMIASSDTRQRDGLLLTELRTLREFQQNPAKYIYMGQGNTPERGGGPYTLIHTKYKSLTKAQRKRHIRTVQGHYFTSEFCSRDLAFTFLLKGCSQINYGEDFTPTQEYMDFLFELDNIVGVPLRAIQKTKEFNDFYVKNNIVKMLVESFNYAGSRSKNKKLQDIKSERAIVQAYINSDRCSFTHPELCFWDKVDEFMLQQMANYYYQNNPHFKYILYMFGLMVKRFDLEFSHQEINMDSQNLYYQKLVQGKNSLEKILTHLGLGSNSTPMIQIWKEHLGLFIASTPKELEHKEKVLKTLNRVQIYFAKQAIKDQVLSQDHSLNIKKMQILQSSLANLTSFTGMG